MWRHLRRSPKVRDRHQEPPGTQNQGEADPPGGGALGPFILEHLGVPAGALRLPQQVQLRCVGQVLHGLVLCVTAECGSTDQHL